MAIAPTGNIFKAFTFGGVSSRNYGVYITGEAVYNAPEREVEMITIPGRNGALALDKGRFENIEVTYPAGIYADNETDFAAAISALRNYLCSKTGYVRLSDEYNPNEYRMAVYKSGLEAEPAQLRAAEFDIVFECQPQRFLTSGETAVTVTSGGTITNPTPFDSSPLLKLYGYGDIQINSDVITASASALTEVGLGGTGGASVVLDMSMMNTGDPFHSAYNYYPNMSVLIESTYSNTARNGFYFSEVTSVTNGYADGRGAGYGLLQIDIQPNLGSGFVKGTSKTVTTTVVMAASRRNAGNTTWEDFTVTTVLTTTYNGQSTITMSASVNTSGYDSNLSFSYTYNQRGYSGTSSKIVLPSPCYIDLDNGEAYGMIDGQTVSVNNLIIMPPELPVLKSGSNTITFDNTFTQLEIVPRWWKV